MEVMVTYLSGANRWVPVLSKPDGVHQAASSTNYQALADVLVNEQPDAITTLERAAEWLVASGHTERSPRGLPGKLSPLVRYERGESDRQPGWTRKPG